MIAEKLGLLENIPAEKQSRNWLNPVLKTRVFRTWSLTKNSMKRDISSSRPTRSGEVPAGLAEFYKEPAKNPLKTPSGKIEFYSQNLAQHFPGDTERPPVPHWIEKGESHDERLSSKRAKKYPLLLMSNHGRWRVHANHDDIAWTREIPTCKVMGRTAISMSRSGLTRRMRRKETSNTATLSKYITKGALF